MPAAWCGVIGLKPSRGRVDTSPAPAGALAEFFLTRSLRDAAAMLDLVADDRSDAPYSRPAAGWLADHKIAPRRCRIGLITNVAGVSTGPSTAVPASVAATALEEAGHEVVVLDGRFLADDSWDAMQLVIRSRGAKSRIDALTQLAGRVLTEDDAEPLMLALASLASTFSDDQVREAGEWQLRYAEQLAKRWLEERVEAVVSPTTGLGAQPLDVMRPTADIGRTYATYRQVGCFTGCWNMTGHAAISLPWWDDGQLPHAVQLVVAPGDESGSSDLRGE